MAAARQAGQMNWAGLTGALDIMFESWLMSIGVDVKKVPYRTSGRGRQRPRRQAASRFTSPAYAIARPQVEAGQDSGPRGDQHHPRGDDPRHSDRRRGRLSGLDHGRAGRTVSARPACRWRCVSASPPTSRR